METRDKMQIELVTENPDYGSGYFYAPLYLPATDADVRDAVQRAAWAERTGTRISP